jgi:hypothetical protein
VKLHGEHLSASEVKLGRSCLRAWAAKYAWDEWPDEPPGPGAALGTALYALWARGPKPAAVLPLPFAGAGAAGLAVAGSL